MPTRTGVHCNVRAPGGEALVHYGVPKDCLSPWNVRALDAHSQNGKGHRPPPFQLWSDLGKKNMFQWNNAELANSLSEEVRPNTFHGFAHCPQLPSFHSGLKESWKIQVDGGSKNDGRSEFRKGDSLAANAPDSGSQCHH